MKPEKAIIAFNDAIDRDPGDLWSYAYKTPALVATDRGCAEAMSTINEGHWAGPTHAVLFLVRARDCSILPGSRRRIPGILYGRIQAQPG
jgi:hypothetical protein